MDPTEKDPLNDLLDKAVSPPSRIDVMPEVWRRISTSENLNGESRLSGPFGTWFTHWPSAALFVVSCALAGILLAEVRASHYERDRNTHLARSYLQLIDPLLREISVKSKR